MSGITTQRESTMGLSRRAAGTLSAVWLALALSACGGASGTAETKDEAQGTASSSVSSSEQTPGATLNAVDLAAAEKAAVAAGASGSATPLDELKEGQIAAKSAYTSGAVVRKAAAVRIPVYRFSNSATGAHFFTTSTTERDNVIATMSPPYSHEGVAFSVASAFSPGLSPVHRFYNTQTGVHFYTISESERASVAANMPQFHYEGIAYHASQVAGQGLIPFYRFYVPGRGFHFYTANESEKTSIIANLAATYSYEGVGYYVLDTNWTAEKLPHSGVSDQLCFQAGTGERVACSTSGATDLNPQQDGHRVAINALSYSAVGSHPLTSCVKDNVTGLIWEGKEVGGPRAGSNTYTNAGNWMPGDVSAYMAVVNTLKVCGYSDWRLPTRQELLGIVDYGRSDPSIRIDWFPNTVSISYWSSSALSTATQTEWYVGFHAGLSAYVANGISTRPVRLVRGSSPSGERYTYSTLTYGSDAANNIVNDAWTGLQWRRCEEGRVWSGSTCTGTLSTFTHEQALAHARDQSGWRLPNIKELESLVDLSITSGATIDATAFPGAEGSLTSDASYQWSSTPYADSAVGAWYIAFATGLVSTTFRTEDYTIRLVRINP